MFRTLLIMAVVSLGWALPPAHAEQSQPPAPPRPAMKAAGSPAVVNINTASIAELDALPGVGAKTAALIIEYRQKNGPFKKIEEILDSSRS